MHSKWKTYDSYENMSIVGDLVILVSRLLATFFNFVCPIRSDSIDKFHELYPSISKKNIGKDDYFIRIYCIFLSFLFHIVKPRVLVMLCGTYGNVSRLICKMAKQYGIVTVDTQHGQIYNHKAYKTSEMEKNCIELLEYLPDYFFSYGEYWKKDFDWKCSFVPVGNPTLKQKESEQL